MITTESFYATKIDCVSGTVTLRVNRPLWDTLHAAISFTYYLFYRLEGKELGLFAVIDTCTVHFSCLYGCFFQRLHENEEFLAAGESAPLEPPRSAQDLHNVFTVNKKEADRNFN